MAEVYANILLRADRQAFMHLKFIVRVLWENLKALQPCSVQRGIQVNPPTIY